MVLYMNGSLNSLGLLDLKWIIIIRTTDVRPRELCLSHTPTQDKQTFVSFIDLKYVLSSFTLFFFRNPTVALDVCLGSLSCWKSARRPRARSDGSIFSFSIEQYICEFMMPSMKCSPPPPDTSSTHAAPHKDTATTMFHCRHHAFFFVFLTFVTPYSFEAISSKNIYLGLITPEYRVPVVFIFVSMGPGKL